MWILYHSNICQLLNLQLSVETCYTGMTARLTLRLWNRKQNAIFVRTLVFKNAKKENNVIIMTAWNALKENGWIWGLHILYEKRTKLITSVRTSEAHQETESTFTVYVPECVKAGFFVKWQHTWRKIFGPDTLFIKQESYIIHINSQNHKSLSALLRSLCILVKTYFRHVPQHL